MTTKALAYITGYMSKTAEDLELPKPAYWKALPAGGSKLDAGRVRALVEASGEEPSAMLKYPGLTNLGILLAGAGTGAAAGAALGGGANNGALGSEGVMYGSAAGTLVGAMLAALMRVKATKNNLERVDTKKIKRSKVNELIEQEADRNIVGGTLKDIVMGTGANNLGYVQELAHLKDHSDVPQYVPSEGVDGAGVFFSPLRPIAQGIMGAGSVMEARKLNK